MNNVSLGWQEIALLKEALATAAARHETQARAVKYGRAHDERAKSMRDLRRKICMVRVTRELPDIS